MDTRFSDINFDMGFRNGSAYYYHHRGRKLEGNTLLATAKTLAHGRVAEQAQSAYVNGFVAGYNKARDDEEATYVG